jgi:hypothetical protein
VARSCFPACGSDADCPAGRYCTVMPLGVTACTSDPQNCFRKGCPERQVCYVESDTLWDFRAGCGTVCSADGVCDGAGEFCGPTSHANHRIGLEARCWRSCDPALPEACPEGFSCTRLRQVGAACLYSGRKAQRQILDDRQFTHPG